MNGPRRQGGHAKLYQDESISIRWYSDTESITISGKDEKEFKEKLTKLASISAGLANGEGKLVDVVDKNRSVSHNDNKSHPNNDLGDSQETCLKNLNCQLQAYKARRTRAHLSRALVIRDKLDRQNFLVCGQHLRHFRHS